MYGSDIFIFCNNVSNLWKRICEWDMQGKEYVNDICRERNTIKQALFYWDYTHAILWNILRSKPQLSLIFLGIHIQGKINLFLCYVRNDAIFKSTIDNACCAIGVISNLWNRLNGDYDGNFPNPPGEKKWQMQSSIFAKVKIRFIENAAALKMDNTFRNS